MIALGKVTIQDGKYQKGKKIFLIIFYSMSSAVALKIKSTFKFLNNNYASFIHFFIEVLEEGGQKMNNRNTVKILRNNTSKYYISM